LRDVSNWQGPVVWKTYVDPTAKQRIREATKAHFYKMGGYHFATPGVGSGEQQAERLLRLSPLGPGRLRPCLDAEWNDLKLNGQQLAAWYLGFVIRVHDRTGYYPALYGSPSYLSQFATHHPEVFGRCPLWLASYGVTHASPPAPWSHWSAWQHTDKASDPAVAGKVDDSYVADLPALLIPKTAKALASVIRYGGFKRFSA
jgi:GH25 family lysozyme M1 (1,4-beta-N-acetylmuramidase)